MKEALKDLNQCLALHPENECGYLFRGNTYVRLKKYDRALADYEQALSMDDSDPQILSTFAYFLATCERDAVRDGKRALKLARRAIQLGDDDGLDSLAAALAETGQYAEAVKIQKQAIRRCQDKQQLNELRKALMAYQTGHPYRDISGSP